MDIQVIDKRQAAKFTGVNETTIYNWIKKGKINRYFCKYRDTCLVSTAELLPFKKHTDEEKV